MNILYLTNHLNIGGITSYVLTLSSGLKKRGHNIFIASSGGEMLPRFEKEGITFIPIPIMTKSEASPKVLASGFKLCRPLRKFDIEIIHANTRVTQVLASLVCNTANLPYVSTCHGFFRQKLHRRIFPCWGVKVIAISPQVKEHLINDFRVEAEYIEVIHNGVDADKFKTPNQKSKIELRREFGLSAGPLVGIVSRLSEVKGHTYLIRAMKDVFASNPDAQLLIAGEGKIKQDLVDLGKSLGIEKSIFFLPNMPDTKDVLSVIDVFVMPSLAEGLGLGLIEAMASSLAVIGSDVGGIKSLIRHGYTGLLVKPKDIPGLTQAILELISNQEKRETFGRNARDFIAQYFSQEEMVLKTERIYQECLNVKS